MVGLMAAMTRCWLAGSYGDFAMALVPTETWTLRRAPLPNSRQGDLRIETTNIEKRREG